MTKLPSSTQVSRTPEARYVPLVKVASGGMATVYVGTLRGPLGFSQLVAIKKPHEHLLEDEAFRRSLIEEARVAAQIRHANVVDVRDIEMVGESIQLIMDYVEGASLGQLMAIAGRAGKRLPADMVIRVVLDALAGLSAVHNIADNDGIPLGLVHRDISPQNILVGVDGVSRVTDFGIAMAEYGSNAPTTQGTLKGKVGYMAPEYIRGIRPDQRVDVFGMGVLLWEALAGKRLFKGANDGDALDKLLHHAAPPISGEVPELGTVLDAVLDKALAKAPEKRFQTADSFSKALEEAARSVGLVGSHADVGREVRATVGDKLEKRMQDLRAAQAALETTISLEDVQGVEDDATTLKYEPAKPGPIKAPPAPIAEARAIEPAQTPQKSRMVLVALLMAIVVLLVVGIAILVGGNEKTPQAGPTNSVEPLNSTPSVAKNPLPNPEPSATTTAMAEPEETAAPAIAPNAPAAQPKATSKSTAATTTATATAKTKRKLPPNPYQ